MARYLMAAVAVVAFVASAQAGGPPPVYVVVDKVILEPNTDAPERIKVEGCFIRLIEGTRSYEYGKPIEGYVYLSLDKSKQKETQEEWAKWQKAARTGKAVAVGACKEAGALLTVKIHKRDERADKPDAVYTPGQLGAIGSLYAEGDSEREPPVRDLLAFVKARESAKPANPRR
jgi:hypothetical protein